MAIAAVPAAPTRAVLLDLEDVLIPWNTVGHWQWAWKPLGPKLPERHVRSCLRQNLRHWDRRRWRGLVGAEPPIDPAIRRAHLLDTLYAIARHHLPSAEAEAVVDRFDKPAGEIEGYDEVRPALARLAAENVPVGAVTELPEALGRRALARAGLGTVRLVAHAEDPLERRLPTKAGYRAAAEALGVPASRTIFVGDLFWSDVRAAARAGMTAVLLDRYDRFPGIEARRIASLAEVPALAPGAPAAEGAEAPDGDGPDGLGPDEPPSST